MTARSLEKGDPELIHRSGGVVGDPVLASVRVESRNCHLIEVWRVMGSGPGDWFRYYFVYAVKANIGDASSEYEVNLAWNASKDRAITSLYWEGGALARRLNDDRELGDMLIALGLPGVHIGKPWIVGGGGKGGETAYVVQSNAHLGYVGIQLLPRGGDLTYQGTQLFAQVSTAKSFPTLQQLEVADRIAKHVREQAELTGT